MNNKNNSVKLSKSLYRAWESVVMETEQVRVEIIPELGAKIVSLWYKATGREWLVDAGSKELLRPAYGSMFAQADMSGWDEVFPTIDPCMVHGYAEVTLPDHGDVWSLSWEMEVTDGELTCGVKGVAGPYRLMRKLSFSDTDCLHMEYQVTNDGECPLPYIWVPHPQFWVQEPTRIIVPGQTQDMLCVFGGLFRQAGTLLPFCDDSIVDVHQTGDGRKYYVPGIHRAGWCALVGMKSGDWLRMSADPAQVPYLGIWIDEGIANDRNVIALEPAIGYYDCLERAIHNQTAQIVAPGQTREWSLSVLLGSGGFSEG